jgi:hypothetical protein
MADQAFHVSDLIQDMDTYRHQVGNCSQSLIALDLQLELSEKDDIEETIRKISTLFHHSNERQVAEVREEWFRSD